MTTKTKRTRALPTPNAGDKRDETLVQFSAQVDEHAGSPQGFADLVYQLWTVRSQQRQISAHRRECFELIKANYARGVRVVGPNLFVIRETAPGVGEPYWGVDAAVVKRKFPQAYLRAKAAVPYVQAQPPAELTAAQSGVVLPPTPKPHADIVKIVEAYKHPSYQVLKTLRSAEDELLARLDKVGADNGWDGLPITFGDGWTVSLRRMQFSAEKLALVEPAVFEAMAVEKTRKMPSRVYLAVPGDEGTEDFGD